MSVSIPSTKQSEIVYPESDGKPMAENTLQFQWIVTIKEGLARAFSARPDIFVAGDLLWYPVEGRPDICAAPDAMVAIGRPAGYRGCYKQWEEEGIAPQVVFEVLSPNNRPAEMDRKLKFYEEFGVDEYYLYDPDHNVLEGWRRIDDRFQQIPQMDGWVSPTLGIRFDLSGSELTIFGAERPAVLVVPGPRSAKRSNCHERDRSPANATRSPANATRSPANATGSPRSSGRWALSRRRDSTLRKSDRAFTSTSSGSRKDRARSCPGRPGRHRRRRRCRWRSFAIRCRPCRVGSPASARRSSAFLGAFLAGSP